MAETADILLSPLKGRMCRGRKSSTGPFVYYMKIESLNIQQIASYSYPLVSPSKTDSY